MTHSEFPQTSFDRNNTADWRDLEAETVHLWRITLDRSDKELSELVTPLSREECERAARYRFLKDRNRFVVRRGVLRILLARFLDLDPCEVMFEQNEFGRPALSVVHRSEIDFNLTHSEGFSLIAFSSSGSIGVDLEQIKPLIDQAQLVHDLLCDSEKAVYSSVPDRSKLELFYRFWTSKEAYLKLLGTGLSTHLHSLHVHFQCLEDLGNAVVSKEGEVAAEVSLMNFAPTDNFIASIAIPKNITKIQSFVY